MGSQVGPQGSPVLHNAKTERCVLVCVGVCLVFGQFMPTAAIEISVKNVLNGYLRVSSGTLMVLNGSKVGPQGSTVVSGNPGGSPLRKLRGVCWCVFGVCWCVFGVCWQTIFANSCH